MGTKLRFDGENYGKRGAYVAKNIFIIVVSFPFLLNL